MKALLISPADPLTGRPRAGPLRRFRHPPPGVTYTHVTDRVAIPAGRGEYKMSPVNVGLAAVKFAMEHAFPIDQRNVSLAHTFFWDVRKFTVPWVHESDQSLGQYLEGYNNVGGFVRKRLTEGYSSYLNSRGCAGVVTWTNWAKDGFAADGVDPQKVRVIPPPFPLVEGRVEHAGCNLLFIGRDYLRKGGDLLLSAFGSLDVPGCRLIYVGRVDGAIRKKMTADPRIIYMAKPSNATLASEVWPMADAFVLPTRADAFAMTVAEAMSRGIPVVASSLPSISEVVEDGASGFLVPPGDWARLGERLSRVAGDSKLRERMGSKAREKARSAFSPVAVGTALSEVYRLG